MNIYIMYFFLEDVQISKAWYKNQYENRISDDLVYLYPSSGEFSHYMFLITIVDDRVRLCILYYRHTHYIVITMKTILPC